VLEIQDLQIEVAAQQCAQAATSRKPWRVVVLFIGVIGGFCCAVILSTLLSHPAGAAVLPGANGTLPGQSPPGVVQPVVTTAASIPNSTQTTLSDLAPVVAAAATPVVHAVSPAVETVAPSAATDLHLAQRTVSPVIGATLQSASAILSPAATALDSIAGQVNEAGLTPALHIDPQSVPRPASTQTTPTDGSATASLAFEISPNVPVRQPAPNAPAPQVPVPPSGASAGSSSPSFGSSPLAGHPALGLLMPAPIVTGLAFGRDQTPQLLLDLRSSPPG
jgi:hypothetical protein